MTAGLDWRAIGRGALLAGAVALATGLTQRLLPERSVGILLLFLVLAVGMVAGGFVAGRTDEDRPLTSGGVAAGGATLVLLVLNVVAQVAQGRTAGLDDLLRVLFVLLLTTGLGVVGGAFAYRAQGRTSTPEDAAA